MMISVRRRVFIRQNLPNFFFVITTSLENEMEKIHMKEFIMWKTNEEIYEKK